MSIKYKGSEGQVFVEDVPEQLGMPAELTISVFGSPWLIERVRELIQRGANLWPDAPAEIKGLADLVTTSKIMQDYTTQPGTKNHDPVQRTE